ncbi:hypothetical protein BB560_000109 [Smittium megazygosporum]|uniref:Uncharacterized protein n=1 Tax=Smittium megazygosporum TaxID=133381 RepID=A0A2T9ZLG5_9FUNG|nr:hypothetical protein BB560_000109 [Smittium megazygosporum]
MKSLFAIASLVLAASAVPSPQGLLQQLQQEVIMMQKETGLDGLTTGVLPIGKKSRSQPFSAPLYHLSHTK